MDASPSMGRRRHRAGDGSCGLHRHAGPAHHRPRRAAPAQQASASGGIHPIKHVIVIMQENRSFDSYFGTYPGADGIPMTNGVPTVCVPTTAGQPCARPYVDHADVNGGGPHGQTNAAADIDGGKMDGFVGQLASARKGCADPNDPACANSATPDVMGYHTGTDIPNYWTYAKNFVLQDHMFEPNASWSLPAHLFMVSEWSAACTQHNDPACCTNALQSPGNPQPRRPARCRQSPPGTGAGSRPIYAWTDLTYLLHKDNVTWGYYVVAGTEPDCANDAALIVRPGQAEREDARDLEPAALLRHRPRRRPSRQHPVGRQLLHRRQERHAARGVLGRARPAKSANTRPRRSATASPTSPA